MGEAARKLDHYRRAPVDQSAILDVLLFLATGGLACEGARATRDEQHAQMLVAMMDHPCEAIVNAGHQCRNEGDHEREKRDVCTVHFHKRRNVYVRREVAVGSPKPRRSGVRGRA